MTLPFLPTGPQVSKTLISSNFKREGFQAENVKGTMSRIAYLDVPLGTILSLRGGVPLRAYFKALCYKPNVGSTGGVVVPFDLKTDVPGVGSWVRSTRGAVAFPTPLHPDIHAQYRYIPTGSGLAVIGDLPITAFDFATGVGSVTLPAAPGFAGNFHVYIYYLTANGEMEIRASRPVGSDGISTRLYGSPLRALHESDQTNARTAPTFGPAGQRHSLPQEYRLSVNVRSSETIQWGDETVNPSRHELVIGADTLPIRVLDAARLNAMAEIMLRGGSI